MGLRILILNTDYPDYLEWLYSGNEGLSHRPYESQLQARYESLFGVADFYSNNLRRLGHEAWDIYANNEYLQKAWAREHGANVDERGGALGNKQVRSTLQLARRAAARTPVRRLKRLFHTVLQSLDNEQPWINEILAAQIKHIRPDVVLNQDLHIIDASFVGELRQYYGFLVGQIASPLPKGQDLTTYDLIISSLPNFVEHFRSIGVSSEFNRLAFDPSVLNSMSACDRDIPVSFVGSLSTAHQTRIALLEHLCLTTPIKIWGSGVDRLPANSPIRGCYQGNAWGIEMYRILGRSKLTLNSHIGIAEDYANNLRLYEATGAGACLVTDAKANLNELFEPGAEVVTYSTPEDCSESIRFYLEHDEERRAIAKGGQARTLREHSYFNRMRELLSLIDAHYSHPLQQAVS